MSQNPATTSSVIPLDPTPEEDAPYIKDGYESAGLLSRAMYSYANPMLQQAYRKLTQLKEPMLLGDLFVLPTDEDIHNSYERFRPHLEYEVKLARERNTTVMMLRALRHAFGRDLFLGALYRILSDASIFTTPIILRLLIDFLKSSDDPYWKGYLWACLLMLANFFYAAFSNSQMGANAKFALRSRNSLMMAVYEHTLKIPIVTSSGELLQLHSTDCGKIIEATMFLHSLWASPLLICVFLVQLWFYVEWAALVGLGIMLITIPLQSWLSKTMMQMKRESLKKTVQRVQTLTECLLGIRICKFMSWEESFVGRIDRWRRIEHAMMFATARFRVIFRSLVPITPMLVAFGVFAVALRLKGSFSSRDVFPAMAVLNGIRMPMMMFSMTVGRMLDTLTSLRRVSDFLGSPERRTDRVERSLDVSSSEFSIVLDSVGMEYPRTTPPTKVSDRKKEGNGQPSPNKNELPKTVAETVRVVLRNATVSIKRGAFTLVMGPTGAGKSTLLYGLLGEGSVETTGRIAVTGSIAYSSQEAWIMNTTLRDNIIMGLAFEADKYAEVVRVCQLREDLEHLPAGDMTEIGEKGINLSGGQKQRVSLARAVYCDADVYIFDDPLSAVDAHVSHSLMHECFLGRLAGKTRLLVTHQTQYAPYVDQIISIEQGSLVVRKAEDVSPQENHRHDSQAAAATTEANADSIGGENKKVPSHGFKKGERIIQREKTQAGEVPWAIFRFYFAAGRLRIVFLVFFTYFIFQLSKQLHDLWISWWPERKINLSDNDFLLWWGLTTLGSCILAYARQDILNTAQFVASQRLHGRVLERIIRAPTSYFDTTPLGRILTVFTRDFDAVDNSLPETITIFLNLSFTILANIALICVATPFTAIGIVAFGWGYYRLHAYYSVTVRGIKRLDGVYRAPVLSLITETIQGLASIRSCGLVLWIQNVHYKRLNDSARPLYCQMLTTRWLNSRLEFLGTGVVFLTALFSVTQKVINGADTNVSLLGLAMSYALIITQMLNGMTRTAGEIESSMNSIERIKSAIETTPQERNVEYSTSPDGNNPPPDPQWPRNGQIVFRDVYLKYREETPLVLRGISCEIASGKRVGIVGRTGSGKSTMLLALFRIVELSGGSICLDGRDLTTLKMKDFRGHITVIPQDPVLFEGTIRSNLDPFRSYTDETIWAAIRKVKLEDRVTALRDAVTANGANFSVGQRQLMCMARALLKNTKVLLMDEATASVDNVTDSLIQKTLRSEFHGCTVLTIAHRLLTVMDSDAIMLLKGGELVEFDAPAVLLRKSDSEFRKMVWQQGEEHALRLLDIAEGRLKIVEET